MGWQNPPLPWSEIERRLSDRHGPSGQTPSAHDYSRLDNTWAPADGGDSPAWSRKRLQYEAPPIERTQDGPAYAELHCHSHFSFLDGASSPEELVEEAARLGLRA
ncbi:MAG: PHP domain-containing protein, partial [Acidimicrobiales bacterium]